MFVNFLYLIKAFPDLPQHLQHAFSYGNLGKALLYFRRCLVRRVLTIQCGEFPSRVQQQEINGYILALMASIYS